MNKIYLSPPCMTGEELELVKDAFRSNWIAPLGPHVSAFEAEMCETLDVRHSVALASGTAALHLALLALGVEKGDHVWCSTLTFVASASPIVYVGAIPSFIDSSSQSWNLDVDILAQELKVAAKRGQLPKVVIAVDLYGQCADYDPLLEVCAEYDVRVIADAAEALGATYKNRYAGTFGEMGILSFNGNKIITTSGGGMLLTSNKKHAERVLHLATQAREPVPHYQHEELGYNYRLSNLLAAVGRGQLRQLKKFTAKRRANFNFYQQQCEDLPGVEFMPEASYGRSNRWLTCLTVDESKCDTSSEQIRAILAHKQIESRNIWKPMHLQPIFEDCKIFGGAVSERLFGQGLCLPSGSDLSQEDLERIVREIRSCFGYTQ